MRAGKCILLLVLVVATVACTNAYEQFYHDLLNGQPVTSKPFLIPNYAAPQIYRGTDPGADNIAMLENGFLLIGYSSFNGPMSTQNDPAAQARKVHANVALVYGRFASTVTGSIPYTVYTPGAVVSAATYGTISDSTGGIATYSGTSSTYIPGSSTTYEMPYQINRYDQAASFWVKSKPPRFGAIQRELTQEERQRYQRNRGVVVRAVVKGSPAFLADILRGDVILRIGEDDVTDSAQYLSLIGKYASQDVDVVFMRGEDQHVKRVHIQANPL